VTAAIPTVSRWRKLPRTIFSAAVLAASLVGGRAEAQAGRASPDSVLEAIRREGMEHSQAEPLAQALMDSIGPRLTGTAGEKAARDWLIGRYRAWGVDARNEQYGTWTEWRRGATHVDLLEPRVRTLNGTLLAYSPGTRGPVQAEAVAVPAFTSPAELNAWLPSVKGKLVLASAAPATCRPDESWERAATPETLERMRRDRGAADTAWRRSLDAAGISPRWLPMKLEAAGAAGVIAVSWTGGWGADRVMNAWTLRMPMVTLDCEDYGLVHRLASHGQKPVLRVDADAQFGGDVPVFNTVATIRGSEHPEEFVVLSAHLDSWDGGSGATDNGAGTVAVMEAVRILRQAYPHPRRTIVIGHWGGEEEGLNGSGAFAADHPQVVGGMQALFNIDLGTGRIDSVSMGGLAGAGPVVRRWLSRIPVSLAGPVSVDEPGTSTEGHSDHSSFACRGAPAFDLLPVEWDYRAYTWHTGRDTYDKLVMDDVRSNAVLLAMLAYLAAEDPQRVPRDRASNAAMAPCTKPARSMIEFLESLLQ
jgi:hypothetical protein